MQVKGIGSGYWRAVGAAEELIEKAAEIPRTWLCGVGFARFFSGQNHNLGLFLALWRLEALVKIK